MGADCSPSVAQAMADSQVANQKIIQDTFASRENQSILDNQEDARAYAALKLRIAHNSATVDHLAQLAVLTAQQTGATENQAQVTPIRTGAADAQVQQPAGAVYPPIRNVDQGASVASTGIQAAMQAIADAMANLQAAINAVLLTAAGGASTPSQTKAPAA